MVENILDKEEDGCQVNIENISEKVETLVCQCFEGAERFSSKNGKHFNKFICCIYSEPMLDHFTQHGTPQQIKDVYQFLMLSIKKYCGTEKEYRRYEKVFSTFFCQDSPTDMAENLLRTGIPSLVNTLGSFGSIPSSTMAPSCSSSSLSSNCSYYSKGCGNKNEARDEVKKDADVPPFSE
jgi:hypothetical protein